MQWRNNLILALGAICAWVSARMTWVTVEAADDKAGAQVATISGGSWSAEMTAVSLVLFAGCVAMFVLRRTAKRIVAIICALAAAGGLIAPIRLLVGTPDPERALKILTTSSASGHLQDGAALHSWAEVTATHAHTFAALVAIVGCAFAFVGAVLVAMRPGLARPKPDQYERKAQKATKIHEDLAADPDSERVMWDALDHDIDPTDR